ncbi:MAG TPA: FAD-dependent oxidoreductase [Solirubrobacterales bacterium]|nr:FAD-dependent oxidoreductase [Solirubrobacterales bacterium]
MLGAAAGIGGAALFGRAASAGAWGQLSRKRSGQPRVAIVGAGLAGLTCAYRLHQGGIAATVYEAHEQRVGGRCWTARGFAGGQTAEHGGEFIDTRHVRIRALARELGLRLQDVAAIAGRSPRLHPRLFLAGELRRFSKVYAEQHLLRRQADRDRRRIGSFHWLRPTAAARALDETSAEEWLLAAAPGPGRELLRRAVRQYMAEEYGLDCDRLSAIAMVLEFGSAGFESDERFHVAGGNDQIPWGLVERLPRGAVRLGQPLASLRRHGTGYALGFAGGGAEVRVDVAVLCLPFTALRRVDLSAAGLGRRRRQCIEQLGMGTNAKLLIQLRRPPRSYDRFDGEYFDEQIDSWDSSLGEGGGRGLLTVYSGGRYGAGYPGPAVHGRPPRRVVDATLARIARAVPGLAAGFDGDAWLDRWAADPWTHGSYAAYLPGQYTRFWGFAGLAEGGLHFGGEHTATEAQGYLEGAVRSGERCAREVAARLG